MTESKRNTIINYAFVLSVGLTFCLLVVCLVGFFSFEILLMSATVAVMCMTFIFKETYKQSQLQQQFFYDKNIESEVKGYRARTKRANELYPMYVDIKMIPAALFCIPAIMGILAFVAMAYRAIYLH